MTTPTRIAKIVEPHGFVRHEEPGFVGWHRVHEDGRKQLLHVFFWRNDKHAEKSGIPYSYVVVVPTLNASTLPGEPGYHRQEDSRLIIVTRGIHGAPVAWEDAAAEFEEIIMPLFDMPEAVGRVLLAEAEETNAL